MIKNMSKKFWLPVFKRLWGICAAFLMRWKTRLNLIGKFASKTCFWKAAFRLSFSPSWNKLCKCKAKEMHALKKSLKAARDFASGKGVHSTNVVNFSAVIPFGTQFSVQYIFQFCNAVPSSVIYKLCVGKPLSKLEKASKDKHLKHWNCSELWNNWITGQSCPNHARFLINQVTTVALSSENLITSVPIAFGITATVPMNNLWHFWVINLIKIVR